MCRFIFFFLCLMVVGLSFAFFGLTGRYGARIRHRHIFRAL